MITPLGAAIAELLAAPTVAAKVGTRVRPIEPAAGDAKIPFQAFVVLAYLDPHGLPHMGVRDATLSMRCYGVSYSDAEALWQACEAVFLDRTARIVGTARTGVFHSGASMTLLDKDPDTAQPYAAGTVAYPVAMHAVPV